MDGETNGKVYPCVEVVEACGEWVCPCGRGRPGATRSFELQSHALAFAEGQRIRLGLDKFVGL
jgi:hypothetical protein